MIVERIDKAVRRRWNRLLENHLGTIARVDTPYPQVALTFDDGPDPVFTPDLLTILADHGAKATFFVVGEAAATQQDLIRRMVAEGHAVGNHSWDHSSFHLLSGRQRRAQLHRTRLILDALGGVRLFRPPFGHQSLLSRIDTWRMGYEVVAWNVLAEDWLDHSAEEMISRLQSTLEPGAIVLLHDSLSTFLNRANRDRSETLRTVRLLLEAYHSRLEFVTVPDLVAGGRAIRKNWLSKPDAEWIRSANQVSKAP